MAAFAGGGNAQEWISLSAEVYEQFQTAAGTPDEQLRIVKDASTLYSYDDNSQSAVVGDFLFFNLLHCTENGFNLAQAQTFMSVIQRVFHASCFQKRDTAMTVHEAGQEFKQQLLERGQQGDGFVFTVEEAQELGRFVSTSLLRNLLAYQYCMAQSPSEELLRKTLEVQIPFDPPALSEAEREENVKMHKARGGR